MRMASQVFTQRFTVNKYSATLMWKFRQSPACCAEPAYYWTKLLASPLFYLADSKRTNHVGGRPFPQAWQVLPDHAWSDRLARADRDSLAVAGSIKVKDKGNTVDAQNPLCTN